MKYTNPVWPGYCADPFVLRVKDIYYAYGTGGPVSCMQHDGKMFPLLQSPDLIQWTYLGGALNFLGDPDKPAYWAPEVAHRDGMFYMYYSAGGVEGQNQQIRVAVSDVPYGPFRDQDIVLIPDEPFSIDAHPFCDPRDGRWYLFFAKDFFDERVGTGIAMVELADDMVSLKYPDRPATTVLRASGDWQMFQRDRFWYDRLWEAWHTVEGPFIHFRDGRYYCFYSGGRWEREDYGVSYGVADSVEGPYIDESGSSGPSVLRGIPGKVPGPGHNSLVLGPDDRTTFMVYHAWDTELQKRRMCIDPLVWTPDGPRCDGPSYEPRELSDI
jgi:arabinan endo-1,5-alpha-L-arabinosidase